MIKSLHIISFDNPYPANYGGAIDVYYRIKQLAKEGVSITLHIFCYGRNDLGDLEELCEKVYVYRRNRSWLKQFSIYPFIVISRTDKSLMKNLLKDNYPILFEGLHTCYYLNSELLKDRKRYVRMHNVEHHYYAGLASSDRNWIRKIYFYMESVKLHYYQRVIKTADHVFAISPNDLSFFKKMNKSCTLMPGYHPFSKVESRLGRGEYILYHGNLSVAENIHAVEYIVNKIASRLNYPFVIAGKNPSKTILDLVERMENVTLIVDPNDNEISNLIRGAQINLLPTFQSTGLKLKLLYALYLGRFVIVTPDMVKGTGLEACCLIAQDTESMVKMVEDYYAIEFTVKEKSARIKHLESIDHDEGVLALL